MIILPAIDILAGQCVRLRQGRYDRARAYARDPVEVARRFEASGARWIHLVDLDAARSASGDQAKAGFSGPAAAPDADPATGATSRSSAALGPDSAAAAPEGGPASGAAHNRGVIHRIRQAVSCRLQVGGGIRSRADVEALLAAGVDRLILGTVLVRQPEEVSLWAGSHAGLLWAGIDADRGRVKISGWQQAAELEDVELARRVRDMGLAGIVYTSITRDGTLAGPDIPATNRVAEACGLPVILSGGIGSCEDIERVLRLRHPSIEGIIVGKAIYEGRLDLGDLLGRLGPAG